MLKISKGLNLIAGSNTFRALENRVGLKHMHKFNFDSQEEIITNYLGFITLIGINLPDTKNLLTENALKKLNRCFDSFNKDDKFSVAILHGVGGNFCSGTALTDEATEEGQTLIKMLQTLRKPVIGALNGNTKSFGVFLAVMCDMLVMEHGSMLSLYDGNVEMEIPSFIYERLLLNLGFTRTSELVHNHIAWPASKCFQYGLVSDLVEHGTVLGQTIAWAQNVGFHSSVDSIIKRKSKILSFLTEKA